AWIVDSSDQVRLYPYAVVSDSSDCRGKLHRRDGDGALTEACSCLVDRRPFLPVEEQTFRFTRQIDACFLTQPEFAELGPEFFWCHMQCHFGSTDITRVDEELQKVDGSVAAVAVVNCSSSDT